MKSYGKVSTKIGLPPGSLIHIGKKNQGEPTFSLHIYDKNSAQEIKPKTVEEALSLMKTKKTVWLDISGVHSAKIIQTMGDVFNIHPLILEDIMNVNQRPKLEEHEDYVYAVIKMFFISDKNELLSEQVSMIVGKNYVLTFQETQGDTLDALRSRIITGKGRVRNNGADYLSYAIIDSIVDYYFLVIEKFSESVELIELSLLQQSDDKTLHKIYKIKSDLTNFKKSIWPVRDLVAKTDKIDKKIMGNITKTYYKDIYDHIIQIIDSTETLKERTATMVDIYLSSVSNKMNEVMKVLTIIATIFIPLTFIAGVYGMNFDNMPELHWNMGYFIVLFVMLIIFIWMVMYFKRKNWL